MKMITPGSENFHVYQDKSGDHFHFFAECPKCGAKLIAYAGG